MSSFQPFSKCRCYYCMLNDQRKENEKILRELKHCDPKRKIDQKPFLEHTCSSKSFLLNGMTSLHESCNKNLVGNYDHYYFSHCSEAQIYPGSTNQNQNQMHYPGYSLPDTTHASYCTSFNFPFIHEIPNLASRTRTANPWFTFGQCPVTNIAQEYNYSYDNYPYTAYYSNFGN